MKKARFAGILLIAFIVAALGDGFVKYGNSFGVNAAVQFSDNSGVITQVKSPPQTQIPTVILWPASPPIGPSDNLVRAHFYVFGMTNFVQWYYTNQ